MLNSFPELLRLDLSFNQITEIDSDSFNGNKNLAELNLEGNYLSQIPDISQLQNLDTLNLNSQNGKLREIPDFAFERYQNVSNSYINIYLYDNYIRKINNKAFCNRLANSIADSSVFIQLNNINGIHKCMLAQFNSNSVFISTKRRVHCFIQAYGKKYNVDFRSEIPDNCEDMSIKKDFCARRTQYFCPPQSK